MERKWAVGPMPLVGKRIAAAFLAIVGMLTDPPFVVAERVAKNPRIGVLWPSLVDQWNTAFLEGLRDNGYSPGVNATIDIRATGGQVASAPRLAEDLLALQPDIVFAVTG